MNNKICGVMNIGLMAVDSVYPNLALMKISSWHKAKGDCVEWYNPFDEYDVVYMSKVFSFTEDYRQYMTNAKEIRKGGTGYSLSVKLAELYEIDLIWFVREKMKYNEKRELLHGKSY